MRGAVSALYPELWSGLESENLLLLRDLEVVLTLLDFQKAVPAPIPAPSLFSQLPPPQDLAQHRVKCGLDPPPKKEKGASLSLCQHNHQLC